MNTVDAILQLSGPFLSDKAQARYRRHLEGLGEKKRGELLSDLQKDAARAPGHEPRGSWRIPAGAARAIDFHHV